mmetsp:Transcript_705/g.1218  ORF Transcript_705/g.1218 Transcript_705/m.1218 type:complete len:428 (+) Transcript_705:116-1399(+)
MASLFSSSTKKRSNLFNDNDDDDDEAVSAFSRAKRNKSSSSKLKRPSGTSSKSKSKIEVEILDSDSEIDPEAETLAARQRYRAGIEAKLATAPSSDDNTINSSSVVNGATSGFAHTSKLSNESKPNSQDETIERAKSVLKTVQESMQKCSSSARKSAAPTTASNDVIELDGDDTQIFKTRKVLTASERAAQTAKSIESLTQSKRSSSSSGSGSGNGSNPLSTLPSSSLGPKCQIVTRLNGKHKRNWTVGLNEALRRIRAEFAQSYGLPLSKLKFVFEGMSFGDADTPAKLDMEDDSENMVDVKVDNDLYQPAVDKVESQSLRNANHTNHKPATQATSTTTVKFKTRLNGQHLWKWKVNVDEKFEKVRVKFAQIYQLPLSMVQFRFDGEPVSDAKSFADLELEDDDLIEVTTGKDLYANAVKAADASR